MQGEANRQRHVIPIQYYQRQDEAKTLLLGGKLLQQYIGDSWAAAEQSRLRWIKTHQSTLQSELYNQVVDAFAGIDNGLENANNLGRKFILPASFQGGTWDMQENLQNSLAISKNYGVADLFITMTANPK